MFNIFASELCVVRDATILNLYNSIREQAAWVLHSIREYQAWVGHKEVLLET